MRVESCEISQRYYSIVTIALAPDLFESCAVFQPFFPIINCDIQWKRGKAMTAEEKPQKKSKGENRNEEQQPDQHPPGPRRNG